MTSPVLGYRNDDGGGVMLGGVGEGDRKRRGLPDFSAAFWRPFDRARDIDKAKKVFATKSWPTKLPKVAMLPMVPSKVSKSSSRQSATALQVNQWISSSNAENRFSGRMVGLLLKVND